MGGMIVWMDEFSPSYKVPVRLEHLVLGGALDDMSWRQDLCPSFGVKLRDKNWVRLWVEHPFREGRRKWALRFTVVIQPDPEITFGRMAAATDDFEAAYARLLETLNARGGRPGRFKILPAEAREA
jgi:hypothetical protein